MAHEALYATYIQRQRHEIKALERDLDVLLPTSFDYHAVAGLSFEMRTKLSDAQPESLGKAKNIEGITPAALTAVLLAVKSFNFKRAI